MTTLVDIPSCSALHIPITGATPLPLSTADLTLTLIPGNPPTHPSQTLTLNIGSSSFPLLPNSPIQKVQSKQEHASYVFSPIPADGGAAIGQVKIVMKDSKSQGEWEATEALCIKFEEALKQYNVWDERVLFVDDEIGTAGQGPAKPWGESIAGAVMGAGHALANRLNAYTERHVVTTNPTHPAPPSEQVASAAANTNARTASISSSAETGASNVGNAIHEGGKKLGEALPDSITKPAEPVSEADKLDLRKMAEGGWEQVIIAAKGLANAAGTVAGSVSENTHKVVEHNFGKQADDVAQDIGQTGANLGSTALSAGAATSAIVQGANATSGVAEAKK